MFRKIENYSKCSIYFVSLLISGVIIIFSIGGCNTKGNGDLNPGNDKRVVDRPVITEPKQNGQIVHPADVYMETSYFASTDPELAHLCTDWEIRTVMTDEVVWEINCIEGVEKVHTHLGDGTFQNSHDGRQILFFDTEYILRTRHRSSSNDPTPVWIDSSGNDIILPGSNNPPSLSIFNSLDELILQFVGLDGISFAIIYPPDKEEHMPVKIVLNTGDNKNDLLLPESVISFIDDEIIERNIYLPRVSLSPGEEELYWISVDGSTYLANTGQTDPDFSSLVRGYPVP